MVIGVFKKIILDQTDNLNKQLKDYAGKWIGVEQKTGAIYLTKVGLEGKIEDQCTWSYKDINADINFCSDSMLNFIKDTKIEAVVGEEKDFLSEFPLGKFMIESYKSKENVNRPEDESSYKTCCPTCNSREYYGSSIQTNRADEPPDIIYTCFNCGHTEREQHSRW